jgi:hypothetical protein
MTFAQIERVIGAKLPRSHRYRGWWSNNSFNSAMTKAWLEAGFETTKVDMKQRKLVFRRIETSTEGLSEPLRRAAISKRHPAFGAMKGLLRVAPGVDLTQPADPEWADSIDNDSAAPA